MVKGKLQVQKPSSKKSITVSGKQASTPSGSSAAKGKAKASALAHLPTCAGCGLWCCAY